MSLIGGTTGDESVELLRNPVRDYAWGSRAVIARLQGRPVPSSRPEAELWVGAHPGAPSVLDATGVPLTELIAAAPDAVLSEPVVARFGPRLPYLLKLLAADAPLSLQAHPDAVQAAVGFAAEEAAGVPRDAAHRRYVDAYHKPELLVAVSEFRALCGFRPPAESARLLGGLAIPALEPVVARLRGGALDAAVRVLLQWPVADRPGLVADVVAAAKAGEGRDGLAGEGWDGLAGELAGHYPGDVGVVVALLLNQVTLAPGEAIFMPAGNLHAYLHGVGVEIMAASDNVLRGGLTPKHVDVPELLRVLRFAPLPDPVLAPVPVAAGDGGAAQDGGARSRAGSESSVLTWPVPVADFTLHRVRLGGATGATGEVGLPLVGPRAAMCLAGRIRVDDGVAPVTLLAGQTAFGPAAGPLRLAGAGDVYLASVG